MLFFISTLMLTSFSVTQDQTSLYALDAARCPRIDAENWVVTVAWGLEQCTDAVKRYTGTETWTVEEIGSQHMPCGCFFDQGSSKIRFNTFQHPCWCWGECGHYGPGKENMGDNAMANQDSQAASDNYQALCKSNPTESTVTNSVFDSDSNGASFSLSLSEARCSHTNTIKTLEQCKASAAALGVTFGEVVELSGWPHPCGCHYNPTQNALRFNTFNHPYYCWSNEETNHDKGTVDLGPRGTVTHNYLHQDKNAINSFPICYETIAQPMFDYVEPEVLEVVEQPDDSEGVSDSALEAMSLLGEAESFYGDATLYGLAAVGLCVVLYQAGNWLSTGHKYNEVIEEVEC